MQKNGEITDLSASGDTSIRDRVIRGDFSLSKINGYTQKRMAGVTFEVTAYDRDGKELEKHRFTTDENGYFESTAAWAAEHMDKNARQGGSAQQTENTNTAQQTENTDQAHQAENTNQAQQTENTDQAHQQENTNQAQQTENTDPAQEEENGRLWFGVGTKPDDSLGALPFGSYHIREIEGKNNRGMKMFSDDFSINEDGVMLSLGEIRNILKPVLETELLDENGGHFADQQGMVTLTDNVTYDGMDDYIGKEVTFHGVIYVKETGKPLQIDQKIVECAETRKILRIPVRFSSVLPLMPPKHREGHWSAMNTPRKQYLHPEKARPEIPGQIPPKALTGDLSMTARMAAGTLSDIRILKMRRRRSIWY